MLASNSNTSYQYSWIVCALSMQVSWHWKSISELDQMWVPKCLRYGWTLPFTPSPYEIGVWKRLYIENVSGLHVSKPKVGLKIRKSCAWRRAEY